MKILFITSTRIGDAVLSSGLLAHLIDSYPDCRITLACGPAAAPLFAATPNVERIITLVKRAAGGHWLDLWRTCATTVWDLVIDLRASLMGYLLLARKRLVLHSRGDEVHRVVGLGRLLGLEPPRRHDYGRLTNRWRKQKPWFRATVPYSRWGRRRNGRVNNGQPSGLQNSRVD